MVEWEEAMRRLGEVFDEVEAAAGRAGDAAAAEADADRRVWEERAEEAAARKAEVRRRAEAMATRMEDTLMEVEARLAEARAKWDREEDAGRRRREEDRELMLEQVRVCACVRAHVRVVEGCALRDRVTCELPATRVFSPVVCRSCWRVAWVVRGGARVPLLRQCRRWEELLEGAADHLETHMKGHNELKFRSLALCSTIERRVATLENRLLQEKQASAAAVQ